MIIIIRIFSNSFFFFFYIFAAGRDASPKIHERFSIGIHYDRVITIYYTRKGVRAFCARVACLPLICSAKTSCRRRGMVTKHLAIYAPPRSRSRPFFFDFVQRVVYVRVCTRIGVCVCVRLCVTHTHTHTQPTENTHFQLNRTNTIIVTRVRKRVHRLPTKSY